MAEASTASTTAPQGVPGEGTPQKPLAAVLQTLSPDQLYELQRLVQIQVSVAEDLSQRTAVLKNQFGLAKKTREAGMYPADAEKLDGEKAQKKKSKSNTTSPRKGEFVDRKAPQDALLTELETLVGRLKDICTNFAQRGVVFPALKASYTSAWSEASAAYGYLVEEKDYCREVDEDFHRKLSTQLSALAFLDTGPFAASIQAAEKVLVEQVTACQKTLESADHIFPKDLALQENSLVALIDALKEQGLVLASSVSSLEDMQAVIDGEALLAARKAQHALCCDVSSVLKNAQECLEGLRTRKTEETKRFAASSQGQCAAGREKLAEANAALNNSLRALRRDPNAVPQTPGQTSTLTAQIKKQLVELIACMAFFYPLLCKVADLYDDRLDKCNEKEGEAEKRTGQFLEGLWPLWRQGIELYEEGIHQLGDEAVTPALAETMQLAMRVHDAHEAMKQMEGALTKRERGGDSSEMVLPEAKSKVHNLLTPREFIRGSYVWRLGLRLTEQCLVLSLIHEEAKKLTAYTPSGWELLKGSFADPDNAIPLIEGQIGAIAPKVTSTEAALQGLPDLEAEILVPATDKLAAFVQAQKALLATKLIDPAEAALADAKQCLAALDARVDQEKAARQATPEGKLALAYQELGRATEELGGSLASGSDSGEPWRAEDAKKREVEPQTLQAQLENMLTCLEAVYPLLREANYLSDDALASLWALFSSAITLSTSAIEKLEALHRVRGKALPGKASLKHRLQPAQQLSAAQTILAGMEALLKASEEALLKASEEALLKASEEALGVGAVGSPVGKPSHGAGDLLETILSDLSRNSIIFQAPALNRGLDPGSLERNCQIASDRINALDAAFPEPEKSSYVWCLQAALDEKRASLRQFAAAFAASAPE